MTASPLRVCVAGGSASVTPSGWIAGFLAALESDAGRPAQLTTNLSCGGTVSVMAMMQLLRTKAHLNSDVLLLEWAINDSGGYRNRPDRLEFWARIMEGLIRQVLREAPALRIGFVMLPTQLDNHVQEVIDGTHEIASHYSLGAADIPALLRRDDPAFFADESNWHDAIHLAYGSATDRIGALVAAELADSLAQPRSAGLPPPIRADNFENASYVADLIPYVVAGEPELRRYENALLDVTTSRVRAGDRLGLRVNGRILGLQLISEPSSALLRITQDDDTRIVPTALAGLADLSLPFLMSHIVPGIHIEPCLAGDDIKVGIELAPVDAEPSDGDRGGGGIRFGKPFTDEDAGVALVGMLIEGSIQPSLRRVEELNAGSEPLPWNGKLQRNTRTHEGRNVPFFKELAKVLPDKESPRLLSYGCSEGYEPLDLAECIPAATVLGCDINSEVLAEAKRRCKPRGIEIFRSSPKKLMSRAPFDAIVALNVLCRYPAPDPDDISAFFPFAHFEAALQLLYDSLAPGGVLVIFNAQYPVEETAVGAHLEPVAADDPYENNGWIAKHAPDGRRITECVGIDPGGRVMPIRTWHAEVKRLYDMPTGYKILSELTRLVRPTGEQRPDTETIMWRRTDRPAETPNGR